MTISLKHDNMVEIVITYWQREFSQNDRRKFHRWLKLNHAVPDIAYKMDNNTYIVAEIGKFLKKRLHSYLNNEDISIIRWYTKDFEFIQEWTKPLDHLNMGLEEEGIGGLVKKPLCLRTV